MKTTRFIIAFVAVKLGLCANAQNLALNGNFEGGDTNFTTDYLKWNNSGPDLLEGYYWVGPNPHDVHHLYASFGDHTSGHGNMMVANAGLETNSAVWRELVSVATNTTYVFSAWGASAYPQLPPKFYFFVNGVQQGPVGELPSQTGIWQNYSALWPSGTSTLATLEVRLLSTQATGNDFALDDFSFRRVGTDLPAVTRIDRAVQISWASVTNQLYQVQWAPRADTNTWFDFGPAVTGNGSTNSVSDTAADRDQKYYRVLPVY
jgi:hypothetical protein